MGKYFQVATTSWQRAMVYRWNSLLEVWGYLLTMSISVLMWRFVFEKTGKESIAGYTASEMTSYLLIAGYLASALWFTAQGNRISNEIKDGVISNYLVRPLSIMGYYHVYGVIGKLSQIMMSTVSFGIVLVALHFWGGISLPISLHASSFIGFILFFLLAIMIQFMIFYNAGLFAFWLDEASGIAFLVRVFADVAAGAFLPLSLFSEQWQGFFNLLPFRYMISIPANVLLGRLTTLEMVKTAAGALIWLAVLYGLALIMMRRGIRHYSAVGR
ncbi:MAG: ABC-2 family transporter protein [bacterium]|nr:ABC-2 family transporter protein [bacterium]